MSVQYASGTKIHNTFSGVTKIDLLANTMSALIAAGWTLVNGVTPSTVTITLATPGVVTLASHGLAANTRVVLNTTGALPSGLLTNTTYFVVSPTTNTFELSLTSGGSAITTAGTQSGVHTVSSEILMQTATTPQGYNLRCRFRDNNGISIQYSIETSDGVHVGQNTTGGYGGSCTPGAGKLWHIVANKFQFFLWVNSSYITGNEFLCVSCPYCFSFLTPTYLGILTSSSRSDTSNSYTYSGNWRFRLRSSSTDSGQVNYQVIYDTTMVDWGNGATTGSGQTRGHFGIIPHVWWNEANYMFLGNSLWRWANGDALTQDPLLCWGLTAPNDESLIRCQLWDAIIIQDQFFGDTVTSFDSHNWIALTSSITGVDYSCLFLVTP